jgi:tRNA threonylcarbamoyl adenosine modification protein YeaZ
MKVLGLDTSSNATSIAVIEDNKLICEYTVNTKTTHSQKLMPMIENMLKISEINVNDMDMIAICQGPGSFTGLRIGMATAKALSHVNNLPIVGVNSLELLAGNMDLSDKKICKEVVKQIKYSIYNGEIDLLNSHIMTDDNYSKDYNFYRISKLDKSLFLTKAEAEAKLKELRERQ